MRLPRGPVAGAGAMSSKKVDGEGEEKASPEDGAYEEPDEEVEGMKAALTAAQREDLKAELEHEIAQLTIKNIALKEKIGKVEKEMTEGITSREAVIAGESETTKTMGEDAAALDADARLEQDALAAALAARTAAKANAVAESRARIESLRAKLEDLRAFQRDHDRLLREMADVQTRQDAFEAQHAKNVQSTTATMEANAVRWAGEMESRRLAATTNLQANGDGRRGAPALPGPQGPAAGLRGGAAAEVPPRAARRRRPR